MAFFRCPILVCFGIAIQAPSVLLSIVDGRPGRFRILIEDIVPFMHVNMYIMPGYRAMAKAHHILNEQDLWLLKHWEVAGSGRAEPMLCCPHACTCGPR